MRVGDLLVFRTEDGRFRPAKVLALDEGETDEGPFRVAHLLMFEAQSRAPGAADFTGLAVWAQHVPIDTSSVERDAQVVGHAPVAEAERQGFLAHLKDTDFVRYLEATGQDPHAVAAQASEAFREGIALAEAREFERALVAYSRAVDLVPGFFQAIDNRAFARMDLGRWDEAIVDWKASLRVNPDNPVALFSLGECHLRRGRFARAAEAFEACVRRWPDEPRHREFLERARARQKP